MIYAVGVVFLQILPESNNATLIQIMGNNITSRLTSNLLSQPQHGVFLDSCVHVSIEYLVSCTPPVTVCGS
jgi:hypothetical protein